MENRPSIDPRYIDLEGRVELPISDLNVGVKIDREKALVMFGSLAIAVVGFGTFIAPSAVSAQGPETPTPASTVPVAGEDLCIIDGDVWEGTISMDNIQNSGEPDVVGVKPPRKG